MALQEQVDSSLSKNQALISLTTVIIIIIKYTQDIKERHVNRLITKVCVAMHKFFYNF